MPTEWVERVFERMSAFYGSRFADTWGSVEPAAMKRIWAQELASLKPNQIARGLHGLRGCKYPPTLPEFIALCAAQVDPEVAFYEAVAGADARSRGASGKWSHPAVYWAAIDFGMFELRQASFKPSQKRWTHLLNERLAQADLPEIPAPMQKLAAPGRATTSRDVARSHLAQILTICKSKVIS